MTESEHKLDEVVLVDGYKVDQADGQVTYLKVILREASYGDDIAARKASERAVKTVEGWKLLESQAEYDKAMLSRQISKLVKPGSPPIPGTELNVGKFTELDVHRIQERIALLELAARLRHGLIEKEVFDKAVEGDESAGQEAAPEGGRSEPAGDPAGNEAPGESDGLHA